MNLLFNFPQTQNRKRKRKIHNLSEWQTQDRKNKIHSSAVSGYKIKATASVCVAGGGKKNAGCKLNFTTIVRFTFLFIVYCATDSRWSLQTLMVERPHIRRTHIYCLSRYNHQNGRNRRLMVAQPKLTKRKWARAAGYNSRGGHHHETTQQQQRIAKNI